MSYASVRASPVTPGSRRRELALQLAVLTALAFVALLALVAGVYLHRNDRREGQRQADLEMARVLAGDESVLVRARVAQRHWWDHFRATHGVLAATAERVVYVGALPPALLRPNAVEPPAFETLELPYDTTLSATRERVYFGLASGVVLHTPDNAHAFAFRSSQRPLVDSVARIVERRRASSVAAAARARYLFDSIAALPPPLPQLHVVRRGETVYGLAAEYGISPEQLQRMNGMAGDRIRANDRLVVKRFRRVNGEVVEFYDSGGG